MSFIVRATFVFVIGILWTAPSTAQDVGELQRCIWRCLSDSPGAGSPQYNACVQKLCNATEPEEAGGPINAGGRWGLRKLDPSEPPYLDGRVAYVESADEAAALTYLCGRGGDSYLMVNGPFLGSIPAADGQSYVATFSFSRQQAMSIQLGEFEGGLTTEIRPASPLLKALQKDTRVSVSALGQSRSFTLRGSSKAIGSALSYCKSSG